MREALKNQTQKSALIRAAIFSRCHALNRYLFELLRRIEEGARRLASIITHNNDKPVRDIPLADVEITEIENALAAVSEKAVSPVCHRGTVAWGRTARSAWHQTGMVSGCKLGPSWPEM
jgi:hypothetical protein